MRRALTYLALLLVTSAAVVGVVTINSNFTSNITSSGGVNALATCEFLLNGRWAAVPVADRLTCDNFTPWGQSFVEIGMCTALEATNQDPLTVLPCGPGETPPQKELCLAEWEDVLIDVGVFFSVPDPGQCASLIEAWTIHYFQARAVPGIEHLTRQLHPDPSTHVPVFEQ